MNVKITNFGHSCLLVETEDRTALFDPGVWSEAFDIDKINHVDRLVITHEHPDHMDVVKIKQIVEKFNSKGLKIVCNESVEKILRQESIEADFNRETNCTKSFTSLHDKALPYIGVEAPDNSGYHFKGVFTHPGDNNSPDETKAILAMPFISPWGKVRDGIDSVVELSPKYCLSIHDWHLSDKGRSWYDDVFKKVLGGEGIEFISMGPGESVDLKV